MAAYDQLPWLPSAEQFLRSIMAGSERGMELSKLNLANQPKEQGGGGGGGRPSPIPYRGPSPEETAATNSAWDMYGDLIRRGATKSEAWAQSGLGKYGVPEPKDDEPVRPEPVRPQVYNVGDGLLVKYDPITEQAKSIFQAPEKVQPPTVSYTFPKTEVDSFLGNPSITLRGTPQELLPYMGTNAPPSFYGTNAIQPNGGITTGSGKSYIIEPVQ